MSEYKEYLFAYRFDGADWGLSIFAKSESEAREKIKAVAWARYEGECAARIPAAIPGAGLYVRLWIWWRNFRERPSP